MSNHPNRGRRRHGHLPGHIRDTFLQAIEAYGELPEGRKLPRVLHQVRYRDRTVSIDEACGLVWSCTDVMPDSELRNLGDWGVMDYPPATRTYAAAARALLADVRARYGVDAGFDARMKRLYDERDRLWDALETVIAGERDFDLSSELGRGQAVVAAGQVMEEWEEREFESGQALVARTPIEIAAEALFKKCEVIVNLVEEAQFGDDDDDPDGDEVRVSP